MRSKQTLWNQVEGEKTKMKYEKLNGKMVKVCEPKQCDTLYGVQFICGSKICKALKAINKTLAKILPNRYIYVEEYACYTCPIFDNLNATCYRCLGKQGIDVEQIKGLTKP